MTQTPLPFENRLYRWTCLFCRWTLETPVKREKVPCPLCGIPMLYHSEVKSPSGGEKRVSV
jgi:predicted RNA-binding Zn-ribbon protein involved in translation (DUF1610 family)